MQCRPAQTQGLLHVLTVCDLAGPRLVQTPWKLCAPALLQRGSALGVHGGDGFVAPHFGGLSRVCSVLGVRGRSPPHQEPLFQRDSTTTAPGWGTAWASATTATSTPSSCPCPSSPPSSSPASSPTSPCVSASLGPWGCHHSWAPLGHRRGLGGLPQVRDSGVPRILPAQGLWELGMGFASQSS